MYQLVYRLTSEVEVDDGIDIELVLLGLFREAPEGVADASELGEKFSARLHECSRKRTLVRSISGACCYRPEGGTTHWSIAPNTGWSSHLASIRPRSPNFMNPVRGAPFAIVSIARLSAMHAEPLRPPRFETVPDPMIVPAVSRRVAAACASSRSKPKCISPASSSPNQLPLYSILRSRCGRESRQAEPSSSGVTATGAKLEVGFD